MTAWTARPGERFPLGEGLRLVHGRLVMVDIPSGRLFELGLDPVDAPCELAHLPDPLGAVAPREGGGWIGACGTGFVGIAPDGAVETLATLEPNEAMRMNDAVADPAGRFWAGSMARDATPGAGSLWRRDVDGTVARVETGITIPNGPAFDATGAVMYLAHSADGIIYRYRVDPTAGELLDRVVFATVDAGEPDGMTVDADGYLWSAVWGAATVMRYAPDGAVERVYELPARQPTSVCLTGTHLVVTTAAVGLDAPGEFDGAVLCTPCTIPGLPTRTVRG
jgi:sugar lactone lactonase YvrE